MGGVGSVGLRVTIDSFCRWRLPLRLEGIPLQSAFPLGFLGVAPLRKPQRVVVDLCIRLVLLKHGSDDRRRG